MDPRAKENNEDSKKEELEQPVIVSRIAILLAWYELTKRNQAEELKVVMKNSVQKTYEWKHYEIQNQRFSQMEGEDYDDWLLQVHQTYLYIIHYIIHNIHESEFYIRRMQRMFSREIE